MSTGFTNSAWLFWIGGGALGLTGLVLLWWSLFRDRSRGRKRCPRCWYDMSRSPESVEKPGAFTCSECGKLIKRERRLYKTRRRRRWALAAIIMVLAGVLTSLQPKTVRDGWWSLISNRMLIAGLPFARDIDDFWCRELAHRLELSTGVRDPRFTSSGRSFDIKLNREEWERFFDRCVAGDWRARPISSAWQRKYGELIRVWTRGEFNMPDPVPKSVEQKLFALPPKLNFRCRDVWPEDVPLCVECSIENWWPYNSPLRARVTPRLDGSRSFTIHGFPTAFVAPEEFRDDEIAFDVTIEHGPDHRSWETFAVYGTEVMRLPVNRQGAMADIIRPVKSAAMDAALSSMSFALNPGSIELDPSSTNKSIFDGTALGLRFEFMLNGQTVVTQNYWWSGGKRPAFSWTSDKMQGDVARLLRQSRPGENWTIRIRSDPAIALRVFDCRQYWDGEVVIPVAIWRN